ncbi:hypothetical protein B0F90DRAFT_1671271 [Multifurca ochricompacta]|uniref:EF-hand domain-containing protein n=1 Tax=Multifurca ochricompacta TaxID=376703 RepID=A0AAD4LVC9_9AGAM|nr:hypothetical protein B0F90DRAFT_1671271 [Multifurca ochricompacta]
MFPFRKRDKKNGRRYQGSSDESYSSSQQQQQQQPESTWGVQGNSAPIGWSPSNPSVERHGSYPPHSGFPHKHKYKRLASLLPPSGLNPLTQIKTAVDRFLLKNCDLDESGGIGFQEQWRQMFDSFDIDHDNRIDGTELGRALAYYNLHVGPSVLDILVKKYDHFVCACVVVQQMCGLYDRFNQGGGGGAVVPQQMSRDEFLIAVISLP